jgi:hypothetical protein
MAGRLAVALALAATLVACGSAHRAATRLTVFAENDGVGRAIFHLECAPSVGDVPHPARACAALAAQPSLITHPRPFTCMGGESSWWDVTISGRFDGKPLHRSFSTCWTTQAATLGRLGLTWQQLRAHLEPRRQARVTPGVPRTLTGLRPSDLVTCDVRGHHLEMGVPSTIGTPASTGYGGADVTSVTLALTRHRDGTVAADCHASPPPGHFVFCGLARTANGFDYVSAKGMACLPARRAIVAVERGAFGPWRCSRAMHAVYELECRDSVRVVRVLERAPGVPGNAAGTVVVGAWAFRVLRHRLDARNGAGGWIDLGRAPWCAPYDAPREVLVALKLRPTTPDGGCFTR